VSSITAGTYSIRAALPSDRDVICDRKYEVWHGLFAHLVRDRAINGYEPPFHRRYTINGVGKPLVLALHSLPAGDLAIAW
jgi:hypothetical protein